MHSNKLASKEFQTLDKLTTSFL